MESMEISKTSKGTVRKKSSPWAYIGIVALILAFFAAALIFFIKLGKGREEPQNPTPEPTPVPAAVHTDAVAVQSPAHTEETKEEKIVYGIGMEYFPESVMKPGECRILGQLDEELEKKENADALFCVEINVNGFSSEKKNEMAIALRKEIDNAECDPAYLSFLKDFNKWWGDIKISDLTEEEIEAAADDREPYFDEFFSYTEQTESKERADEYRAAWQRLKTASENFDDPEVPQDAINVFEDEVERLRALGFRIDSYWFEFWNGGKIKAFLTREQIKEFPADLEYTYLIYFAGDQTSAIED